MAQYLVTGGAGFIGSHLCRRLLASGCAVRVLDDLSSGRRENLAALDGEVDLVEGDLRDEALVSAALAGVDYVLHHAAVASVQTSIERPRFEQEVNAVGTLQLFEAARRAGVRRVVFAASAASYGKDPTAPKREEMLPAPESPYAISKIAGEYYARVYSSLYGLEVVCLRYFNVFGPRQDPSSPYSGVISIFAERMLAGAAPTVFGDGGQSRDFVYVDNVVEANMQACTTPGIAGRVRKVARVLSAPWHGAALGRSTAGAAQQPRRATYRSGRGAGRWPDRRGNLSAVHPAPHARLLLF